MPSNDNTVTINMDDALDSVGENSSSPVRAAFLINETAKNMYDNYEYARMVVFVTAIVVPIIFAAIFLVGVIGNFLLVITVLRNKVMRTNPNVFLVSLAIGDILLLLISVPITSTLYTLDEWSYGTAMCKINEFLQTLSLGVSIFTLTAVSGDRFIAIVYPLASYKWSTMRRTLQICAALWLFSFAVAIPDFVCADVTYYEDTDLPFLHCNPYAADWGKEYKKFRPMFRFVIFFVIPILVISVMYVVIAITLLKNPVQPRPRGAASNITNAWAKQIHTRKKVSIMVLSIVVLFVVCWLPRYIHILWYHFTSERTYNMFVHIFKVTGFCLSFAYSSVNPVAFYFISDDFRRFFDHYLFGCCCKSKRLKKRRGTGIIGQSTTLNGGRLAASHSALSFTPGTTPNISLEDLTRG